MANKFEGTLNEIRAELKTRYNDKRVEVYVDRKNYGSQTIYLTANYDGWKRKTLRKVLNYEPGQGGISRYSVDLDEVDTRFNKLVELANDEERAYKARMASYDRERRAREVLGIGYGEEYYEKLRETFGWGANVTLNGAYEDGSCSVKVELRLSAKSLDELRMKMDNLLDLNLETA